MKSECISNSSLSISKILSRNSQDFSSFQTLTRELELGVKYRSLCRLSQPSDDGTQHHLATDGAFRTHQMFPTGYQYPNHSHYNYVRCYVWYHDIHVCTQESYGTTSEEKYLPTKNMEATCSPKTLHRIHQIIRCHITENSRLLLLILYV